MKRVMGNVVFLDKPLCATFEAKLRLQMRAQGFVERSGVENLYIKLSPSGDPLTIAMRNAAYCWGRNIESEFTRRNHVGVSSKM